MKNISGFLCSTLIFLSTVLPCSAHAATGMTIIKDSGGRDLIENSLVAATLSVSQGADYLELPVNMSSDGQLVVFRDTTLNRLTDIAEVFPERQREDGSYYVVDFTLAELRQLRLRNVFEEDYEALSLGMPTLIEEINLIKTLNSQLQQNTGVIVELIEPKFYSEQGFDIGEQLRKTLALLSYTAEDKIFIQCADPDELQKISRRWHKEDSEKFPLIQIIKLLPSSEGEFSDNTSIKVQHSWLFTNSGLRILASYASAVTLPYQSLNKNELDIGTFAQLLHNYGLKVFINAAGSPQPIPLQLTIEQTDAETNTLISTQVQLDGIYLERVPTSDTMKLQDIAPTLNEQITNRSHEESTLPPFFSNLGLSQPKPTANNQNSESQLETEALE